MSTISASCNKYFQGFQDIQNFKDNDAGKNILGILKIASYFTVILPLIFGAVYGLSSLVGRVCQKENLDTQDKKISSIKENTLGRSIDEQIDELFQSSKKAQKLFTIDQNKIGVIFNPHGGSLNIGFFTVKDSVVLVTEKDVPDEVTSRITGKIPPKYTHSTLTFGSMNGQSTFKFLGFE